MLVTLDDTKTLHETGSVRTNKLTGTVTKELNAIDTFPFNIYPDNSCYSDLKELTSLIKVYDDKEGLIFDGRVLTISPYMTDSGEIGKQVVCEGGLCFLKDSVPIIGQLKCTIRTYIATLLSAHNSSVEYYKQIHLGSINCSQAKYTFTPGYEDTFSELTRNLISNEDIGGEMRVRVDKGIRFLDYTTKEFSETSDKTIQLGKNMRSITQAIDPSEIVTRLYPLGAIINDDTGERVTLSGLTKYIDNDQLIERYGVHAGTMIFDNITTPGTLSGPGKVYAAALKAAKVQYEVSAIDIDESLDGFAIGCKYRVVNSHLGIDEVLRCIGTSTDINDRSQNTLTFGDKIDTISGMTSRR